jgi:hypothetical protein
MTPIIVKTTDGENVTMPLSEFNKIIEQITKEAYDEGFEVGRRSNYVWYSPAYNPPIIHWDDHTTPIDPYKITCDTNSNKMTINSTGEVK